jgi:hypothetical protein
VDGKFVMICIEHNWLDTGIKRQHVQGEIFKYGTPTVTYVKCSNCGQNGFRKPNSRVIYTWKLN